MKVITVLLCVWSALGGIGKRAYAQNEVVRFEHCPYFGIIPKVLTQGNSSVFYSCELNGENQYIYTVYDTEFNVKKQFPIEIVCFKTRSVIYEKDGGNWTVISDETNSYLGFETFKVGYLDCDLEGLPFEGRYDEEGTILFQNLFSASGRYESLHPVYTMSAVADTIWDEQEFSCRMELRYHSRFSGIELREDGAAVRKIEIPFIEDAENCNVLIIKLGGVFYMELDCRGKGCCIYRIAPDQNSLSLVKSLASTRMYPSILRPGEAVSIDFGAGDTSVDGELLVTDAAGRVVERRPIPVGTTDMQISTHRLRAGSYNFTVYRGGKVADSGKIIIR